jgi:ATP-binding cassette subfamily C (CFTR/MRP) protein 1
LRDRKVAEQGAWQTIQSKGASLAKFIPPKGANRSEDDPYFKMTSERLNAQLLARDEAEVDLTRQTGDLAVYGIHDI